MAGGGVLGNGGADGCGNFFEATLFRGLNISESVGKRAEHFQWEKYVMKALVRSVVGRT